MRGLVVAVVAAGALAVGCSPQQEIHMTVDRKAKITDVTRYDDGTGYVYLRLTGEIWCAMPTTPDLLIVIEQDGKRRSAYGNVPCRSSEPTAWSGVYPFWFVDGDELHAGPNVPLTITASTNDGCCDAGTSTGRNVNIS